MDIYILYAITTFILIYDSWSIGTIKAQLEEIEKKLND